MSFLIIVLTEVRLLLWENTLKNCHIAMKWRYLLKITAIGSGSTAVRGEKISPASKLTVFKGVLVVLKSILDS